tara:strand:+ start:28907 stop:29782 length:876 start_codon:yes stop_codon:yes gene_type:complete
MSKGIIIFASNNGLIDYIKIACASSGFARKNLSGFDEICLITDSFSLKNNKELIEKYFDRTIVQDAVEQEGNIRLFKDGGTGNSEYAPFINKTRGDVYSLSPYDESLVIDCDYFIMSNTLDQVWGSENDFMINCQYRDVAGRHGGNVSYIDDFSIPMYWATVFYFRKSDYTKNLFSLIEHIKDNYKYYYFLYNCAGTLYRNDFSFSMAIHIINGTVTSNAPSLPIDYLNNSFDLDEVFRVNNNKDILMFCAKPENTNQHILAKFNNTDIHIMNKKSIERVIDDFLDNGSTI